MAVGCWNLLIGQSRETHRDSYSETARRIIGDKIKESDLRDVTFGLTVGRRGRRRSRRRKKRRITSISNYWTVSV